MAQLISSKQMHKWFYFKILFFWHLGDLENSTTQASTRRRSQNQKHRKTSSSVHSTSAAVTAKPEGSNPQQPASEVKEEDQILIEMKDSQAWTS